MRTRIDPKSERGATMLVTALILAALILVVALVVDVANWYVHKRHLQTQADAAALAGASAFTLPTCNNTAIQTAVEQYSGKQTALAASPYNVQVGGTPDNDIQIKLNSASYWVVGGTNTNFDDTTLSGDRHFCDSSTIDVKMSELGLPWFLGGSFVPKINAHARASMRSVSQLSGQLPIGVVDVNPQSGAVIFYDEADPGNLSTTYVKRLTKNPAGPSGGLNEWYNTGDPASVTMPSSGRLGVVVAFSSDGPPLSAPLSISGTVTDICGRARVDCYNAPASSGLLFAHGYSTGTAGKPPMVRGATLSTANCPDLYGYFTYNDASCNATLSVTFGSTVVDLTNVQLSASVGGSCGGGGDDSAPPSFTRTFTVNIPAHAGPCPITVTWIVKNETGLRPGTPSPPCQSRFKGGSIPAECQGSFGIVQRVFGGDQDISGPVRTAHLINMGSPFGTPSCPGPLGYGTACNSFPIGDMHSLAIDVQLAGAVSRAAGDPPVLLRIVGGSRNGTIDCNKTGNLRDQLANGCDLPYKINKDPSLSCPWATKNALLASPQPYPCVAVQTGGSIGQFTQGIQDRILNGSNRCPAAGLPGRNYWNLYPDLPDPGNPVHSFNDPRIVYVFMVPYGSFRGSGNAILPIVSFGIFYVRGWGGNGGGNDDPCTSDLGYVGGVPAGDLAGNFITHVADSATASGTEACVIGSFNPCVVVLTK